MRTFFLILIIPFFTYSQKYKGDLFLEFDDTCLKLMTSKENRYEHYFVKLTRNRPAEYQIEVTKDTILNKRTSITTSAASPSIFLIYENENDSNGSFLIDRKDIINRLNCEEILFRKNTNLEVVLSSFKNIYLAKYDNQTNKYLVKKVSLIFNKGL